MLLRKSRLAGALLLATAAQGFKNASPFFSKSDLLWAANAAALASVGSEGKACLLLALVGRGDDVPLVLLPPPLLNLAAMLLADGYEFPLYGTGGLGADGGATRVDDDA